MVMDNELVLVKSCQSGNSAAFGQLYDFYVKHIYDFIYYKTFHQQTAEDLTSQSFLKALKAIGGFRVESGSFQAWLYQIARNTVIDHYRTQKHNVDIEDVWDLSSADDLPNDLHQQQVLEQVQAELKNFSAEQREIVLLRVWGQLSYAEIAQITGKTENNCKVIFFRMVKKLKDNEKFALLLLLASFFV